MRSELRKGRFEAFQAGEAAVLSCTDIASRGLDTVKVKWCVYFLFLLQAINSLEQGKVIIII